MDDRTDPTTLAGWLAQLADLDLPTDLALSIAESCEAFRDAGALDNWQDIFSTAQTILKNAQTYDRAHGDVNPQRASVDTLKREYDRMPMVVGRAVDPWQGQYHRVRRGRNKKGATAIVTAFGAAPVQGSCAAPDPDNVRAAFASHLLTYARHLHGGLVGYNVTAIANHCYGDLLDQVPIGMRDDGSIRYATLLGTEVEAHEEHVPEDWHPGVREPIAEHNAFGPVTWSRSGIERGPVDERGPVYGPRLPVVTWQAHATCSHTDETRRGATRRTRLARVKPRKSEAHKLAPRRTLCLVRAFDPFTGQARTVDLSITRSPLIAPADHDHLGIVTDGLGLAWFGHRLMLRNVKARQPGKSHDPARDRARSERRATVSRTLPGITIESTAGWQAFTADFGKGRSERVRVNDRWILNLSRSEHAGKFNCKVYGDAPVGQTGHVVLNIQVRSAATLARRLSATIL